MLVKPQDTAGSSPPHSPQRKAKRFPLLGGPWRSRLTTITLCAVLAMSWSLGLVQSHPWQARAAAPSQTTVSLEPSPPITLGLQAPPGSLELGKEFLILGHRDRLLDRELGDRIQQFWPLRELLLAFNREFRTASPLTLTLATCPDLSPQTKLEPIFQSSEQGLVVCYSLLQQMDDYADDLSGSLTEQHLAVLDMFYFTVTRELSRLVLAASHSPEKSLKLGIKPLEPTLWAELDGLSPEAAVDRLTAQLPQRLQLQQQTAILSGTQWLFNQGHPLLSPAKLRNWTGQPMDESNYKTLICTARKIHPEQFPFLEQELPAELDLANCS